jgi:hypothetical protein
MLLRKDNVVMKIVKIISIFILSFSFTLADTNITTEKVHFLDTLHADISEKVLDWSTYLDITVGKWLGYDDELNATCIVASPLDKIQSKKVDSFFQNNKYIAETENVFIRVRTDTTIQSRESDKFRLKFRAQLPFSRCRKQLKLFVEDVSLTKDKSKIDGDGATDVGFRYEGKKRHGIKSRYSIGFSGLFPFVSARYSLSYKANNWEIEPVQTFKYSSKYYLEEESNIYFDKTLSKDALFRMTLQRGTESTVEGMDYGLKFEYYSNAKKNKGLHFEQAFYGNTKYRHRKEKYRILNPSNEFYGINNYVTTFSYRANIWRKWFFYEIQPGVNFHRDFNYKPNYSLRFFFDFYFGEYH